MKAQNNFIRKGISFLMIITLLITGFFITPNFSFAQTIPKTEKGSVDIRDLAYYDIWKHEDGTWQKGIRQGASVSQDYPISESKVPDGAIITSVTGEFNNSFSDKTYWKYAVPSGSVYDVKYEYAVGQKKLGTSANIEYTVSTILTTNDNGSNGQNIKQPWQAAKVEGYRYYIPVHFHIEYEITTTVEITDPPAPEEINAEVTMPATAKTGETVTISDGTLVGSETILDEVDLYLKVDNGEWEYEATWEGSGLKGQNTGGSIQKYYDTPCTVEGKVIARSEGGLEDTDTGKTIVEDGRVMSVVANLELDSPFGYEGHPFDVYDYSTFEVDGEGYSAKRAYEEGIAKSSYRVTGGTIKKDGLTSAICTIPKKGFYPITLTVTMKNGDKLPDTETKEIRKTPYVTDNLGGFQKQNRKQTLTFNIATYPDKPIVDYDITIKDLKSNELIRLTKDASQENGAVIKTRTVKSEVRDQYWTTLTVEFLTKYPRYDLTGDSKQKFSYKIKVMDSKGDYDEAYKEFEVAPDIPPIPAISMQDSFLREAGSNIASIEAADASSSDGDQLARTWSVANHSPLTGLVVGQNNALAIIPANSFVNATLLSGYQNLAFGTNQTIGFNKEGVSKSTVKLHVKDVWNEATLEEYINPLDYLEAETTASTQVINIAPVVSIEPIETLKANIAIMVTKNKLETVRNQSNSMKANLLEKGIDGIISFIPVAENYDGKMIREGAAINPDGASALGQSISSSDYAYVMEATNVTVTDNSTTANNVKIVAYDKAGKPKWNYAFTEKPSNNKLFIDNQEKYLIFSNSNYYNGTQYATEPYTLIFNAKTGALLTKLNNVGVHQDSKTFLSTDEKRMYFFNGLGVQKLDFKTGKYTSILTGPMYAPRLIGGKVGFVGQMSDMKYYIGKFDMTSELCDKLAMPTADFYNVVNAEGTSWVQPIDWSNDGKVLVVRRLREYSDGANGGQAWVLDANTQTQFYASVPVGDDKGWESFLVKDSDGNADYFSIAYGHKGTTKYYSNLIIYKINGTKGGEKAETVASWGSGKAGSSRIPNTGYYDKLTNKIYLLEVGYYGRCWIYNLTNNRFEEASSSISAVGFDPITGTVSNYDGGLVSHYYKEGWNGNGSFYYVLRYKTPITSNQSAYKGIIEKADLGEGKNYIVNYGLGGLSKVEELATVKNAVMISIESNIESLAEKIEEIGTAPQYMLNLIGNGLSNIGAIFKNINLDPNAEYEYSYDLQTVSGSAIDVFKESHTNTINASGITYYKEVVYQADLTNGSNSYKNGFVSYDNGTWFNVSRDGDAGFSGSVTFTMEKDGYVELSMANDCYSYYSRYRYLYLDEKLISYQGNNVSEYGTYNTTFLTFLKAGKHTIKSTAAEETHNVIKAIEIGYLSTTDNSFSSSSVSNYSEGTQTVTGTFKAGKEIAYTEEQSKSYPLLNLHSLIHTGQFTYDEWDKGYYSITPDGKNFNATYTGRISNKNRYNLYLRGEIKAPPDKMMLLYHNRDIKILNPNEGYYVYFSQQYYDGPPYTRTDTILGNFYAVEIPIGAMGVTTSSAISFSEQATVKNYSFKNKGTNFYKVEFPSSTTAKLIKCISGAEAPSSKISFTTEKSKPLLSAIVSNFVLKSKYTVINIKGTYLADDFCSANGLSLNGWNKLITGSGKADIKLYEPAEKEEDAPLIYKKGQLIAYGINYSDYENDPSKKGYWLYAHTPYNDGEHENAAVIYDEDGNIKSVCGQAITPGAITIEEALTIAKNKGLKILEAPIDRFYVDGKYTVYHWEYDNTSRGIVASGYPVYDKVSNTAELTFYIQGGASAPWITGISTSPAKVLIDKYFSINIGIDDAEKDVLNLTTEVYKDRKLIFTHRKKNIKPIDDKGRAVEHGGYVHDSYGVIKNPTTGTYEHLNKYKFVDNILMAKTGDVVRGYNIDTGNIENIPIYEESVPIGYPVTNTGALPQKSEDGTYDIVCTVRDQTGADIGTYKFNIEGIKVDATVDATKSLKSGYGISATVKTTTKNTTASKVVATLPSSATVNMVKTGGSGNNLTWEFPANTGKYATLYNQKYNATSRQVFVPVKFPDDAYYIIIYRIYDSKSTLIKEINSKTYVNGNMYDDDYTVKSE